jgi:hypothetical protein
MIRAPQYRRVDSRPRNKTGLPPGPNPAASQGLRVKPFANIFALVDGLGVITLHRSEADAKTALESELERRRKLRSSERAEPVLARSEAHNPHDAEPEGEHRPS